MITYFPTSSVTHYHHEGFESEEYDRFLELTSKYPGTKTKRIERPEDADLVLFIESIRNRTCAGYYFQNILKTTIYKRFKSKVAIFSASDTPFPIIPGVYGSIPNTSAKKLNCVGGPYLNIANPYLFEMSEDDIKPNYLASYSGCSPGKPVRIQLNKINSQEIVIKDTTAEFVESYGSSKHDQMKRDYIRLIQNSKFSICPKGYGPSTYRLFETLQLGRAPVIISNDWTPPPGPDWESFAIFVPEKDVLKLPNVLRELESEWENRGQRARAAWLDYFSPQTICENIVLSAYETIVQNPNSFSRSLSLLSGLLSARHLAKMKGIAKYKLTGVHNQHTN